MSVLKASVPAIPENRSEVVPARLARKLAPLFGVSWDENPFDRTWTCDYTELTLAEIGRGAPMPARGDADAAKEFGPDEHWRVVGRAVVSRPVAGKKNAPVLPNEIAGATLHKFGPDTKAAVVLTGGNRLFAEATTAISQALGKHLRLANGDLPAPHLRLAVWARLVHDAYTSQPCLFAAVAQARSVQRALTTGWGHGIRPPDITDVARCEIGAAEIGRGTASRPDASADDPSTPRSAPLVDETVRSLYLQLRPAGADNQDQELLLDDLVNRWLRHLLQIGVGREPGMVWVTERRPGHRSVEVFHPWLQAVRSFVNETSSLGKPDESKLIVGVPDAADLRGASDLEQRTTLLAVSTALRYVRQYEVTRGETEERITAAFVRLAALAADLLGADDPVTIEATVHEALARARTHREREPERFDAAVTDLRDAMEALDGAIGAGRFTPGVAAELISAACVGINTLRRERAERDELDETLDPLLDRYWGRYFELLGIPAPGDVAAELPEPVRWRLHKLRYYLHNYAGYLAGARDDEAKLRQALEIFDAYVLPARRDKWIHSQVFEPYRIAMQVSSRARVNLADLLRASGRTGEAMSVLEDALAEAAKIAEQEDALTLLTDPERYNTRMLNTALSLCRVWVRAMEWGVPTPSGTEERAREVLSRAREWIDEQGPEPVVTLRRLETSNLTDRFRELAR